jgi:hypothetical protein
LPTFTMIAGTRFAPSRLQPIHAAVASAGLAERSTVVETLLMLKPDGAGPGEESCPAFSTLL